MNIQLSVGMAPNPRTWPLFDGRVKPDGIELIMSPVHASELFWRQLRFGDFDLSDMSFSSLLIAIAHGDKRWVGLPIFTTRRLFHTGILVRRDAGIDTPADLKGKRVGVPEYQQTAALWSRGALQEFSQHVAAGSRFEPFQRVRELVQRRERRRFDRPQPARDCIAKRCGHVGGSNRQQRQQQVGHARHRRNGVGVDAGR